MNSETSHVLNLILMRHGIAEPLGPGISRDADRPLTDKGRERTRQMARAALEWCGPPDSIWSSPLLRARQTAEIVGRLAGRSVDSVTELRPGGDPVKLLLRIRADNCGSIWLTGHMPDLSILAAVCLTGQPEPFLDFKKAGLALIRFRSLPAPGTGELEALIQPSYILSAWSDINP